MAETLKIAFVFFTLFSKILHRHNDQEQDFQLHVKESQMQPQRSLGMISTYFHWL